MTDIYDHTNGQCTAGLAISGTYFQCQLATDHTGWAHQNMDASALWQDAPKQRPVSPHRPASPAPLCPGEPHPAHKHREFDPHCYERRGVRGHLIGDCLNP